MPNPGDEVLSKFEAYMNPGLARVYRLMGLSTAEVEANGSRIRDSAGHEYLDFAGGYGVFSHGHRHPKVIEAVRAQLDRMPLSSRLLPSQPAADLAEALAMIAPGELRYSFFCNSGTEAVEGCIKMARLATGRTGLVGTVGGFHGKTMGSLSVSGREVYRKPFEPLIPGVTHVPFGDAEALDRAVGEDTAGVILEPIQGEGGVMVPPDDYLPAAREICSRKGALLIVDEVQTGFGRTGSMFAVEHYGVEPDLMALSKALGGGVMPLGGFMGTPQVWEPWESSPLVHTSTFGGNPLACAAGLAAVRVAVEEDLPGQAREKGEYALSVLKGFASDYGELIEQVRGKGLLIGVQFRSEGIGGMVMAEVFSRGLLAVYTLNNPKVIRIEPPLTIPRADLDRGLEILGESLKVVRETAREL